MDLILKRENDSLSEQRLEMYLSRAESYFAVGASVGVEEVVHVLKRP